MKVKPGTLIGIDIFAGAGGMSLGAEMAGIAVALAVELERNAFRTYARNHPRTLVLHADANGFHSIANTVDRDRLVVFGGPPCQGFSTSNQRTRTKTNQSNWLYQSFVRFVRHVLPAWVVFENVQGILTTEKGHFAKVVERDLRSLGYDVSSGLLNAAEFGVPQRRSRFFLIARKQGKAPALPLPMANEVVTVKDAIDDLPVLKNGANKCFRAYRKAAFSSYARTMRGRLRKCTGNIVSENASYVLRRYAHIPKGGNWKSIPSRMMDNYADRTRCHTGIYKRLKESAPAVVIGNFRKNMLIHPTQCRGLSVREAARLQSFPDWYSFEGSIGLQQQQVGNAVPPLLAKAVFETIVRAHKEGLKNGRHRK